MSKTDISINSSTEELRNYIADCRKELIRLRFKKTTKELKNTSSIRIVKRSLARALTFLGNKNNNR